MNESENKTNYLINGSYDRFGDKYLRWSQDFHHLIDDIEGVKLFKKYLNSEGFGDLLDFWFACEGLKKTDDKEMIKKLINVIFKKFIMKSQAIQLTDGVKTKLMNIKYSADSNKKFDRNIFDEAQNEVEEQMKSSIYENFLRSEIYLSYMQSTHNQCLGATALQDRSENSLLINNNLTEIESTLDNYNNRNQYYDVLPTLHEDSELQTSYQTTNTNNNTNIRSHSQKRTQTFSNNESHSMMPSKSPNLVIKNLNLLNSKSTANSSSRLTTEPHPLSPNNNTLYPAYQSYFRSKAMANPPNPYHVKYATILPTSAQDSELQSISSHSTNESMSCVGGNDNDSGFNSGLYSLPHTKKQMQHMNLAIKQNAKINSTNNTISSVTDFMPLIHPRPIKPLPPSAYDASNPDKFASILIEKLDKIKRQQDSEIGICKKLAEALQECAETASNNNNKSVNSSSNTRHSSSATDNSNSRPKQTLKDVFIREKFDFIPSEESDQSIIDKHFAQVFNETPNETPTDIQQSITGFVSPPKHNHRLYIDGSKGTNICVATATNNSNNNPSNDSSLITVTVKYSTESFPYKLNLTGPHITFRKFKQHIPAKRGNWQYYFKRKCNDDERNDYTSAFVYEKISDDNDLLPQIEGKIFAIIESN
jgi:hypothetical protein